MGRYQRDRARPPITIAALMAYATNIGVGRMAEISNITRSQLSSTAANFIRLETLKQANDRLANATARLPIFQHYAIGDVVHSSSDGQKFESAIPTVNARHSAKYFGLKKGVVAYTLLASHVPLSARIIGANEHESHYVFDVLFNNFRCLVQQLDGHPARNAFRRHAWCEPGELRVVTSVWLSLRSAVP